MFSDTKSINDDLINIAGNGLIFDYFPFLRPLYYSREQRLRKSVQKSKLITERYFKEHKDNYISGFVQIINIITNYRINFKCLPRILFS